MCLHSKGMEAPVLRTLPDLALCISSSSCSSISFNKLVNIIVFLSSASHSSKLIEPEEGVMGTSDLANRSEAQVTTRYGNWNLKEESGILVGLNP